jgi:hypothetical protein
MQSALLLHAVPLSFGCVLHERDASLQVTRSH